LAYPRLAADARDVIACDHFTNAMSDPEFALKIKRVPKSLDEALNIALRLEAWAKSISRPFMDDDRVERQRPKVRGIAKPEAPKATTKSENTEKIASIGGKDNAVN